MEFNGAQADGDDYLRFLPSDDELSDDEPAAQPEDDADRVALALAAARISPALLLAPADAKRKLPRDWRRQPLGDGVVARRAGEDVRVSRESMEQHAARRKQLLSALDACSRELSAGVVAQWEGDAPFRFARGDCEMPDASPKPTPASEEMHVPEKKQRGRGAGGDGSEEELQEDADPLYDERMDDADAKWVLSNFGGEQEQDAGDGMLCCPCCFVTVCMSCERHVKYSNQFRARSAVNCRVNKDEVLAYVSSAGAQRTSLPFQKRLQASQSSARVLQEDEYYPVQCSDCNTTVGVFDHVQQFHFFNVLPSS